MAVTGADATRMPILSSVAHLRPSWKAIAAAAIATAILPIAAAPAGAHGRDRDRDRDGLSDRYEQRTSHTNPRMADTDRDGLGDGYEVRTCKTNPRKVDTDGDGLSDRDEVRKYRTDPRKADTDGDGISDGAEVKAGSNPRNPKSPGTTTPPPGDGTPPGGGTPPGDGGGTPPGGGTPTPKDTTPPETTILSGTDGPQSATTASFSFSANETATFECRLDNGAYAACSSPKTYDGLADGAHTFSVRAKDTAGNVDATPATAAWSVDTTPPQTTITSGPPATTTEKTAQFTFSAGEVSTFQCRLDAGPWAACSSPTSLSGLALGTHTYEVRAIDGLGNIDASPAQRTWTIESVAPDTTITGGPSGDTFEFSATLTFTSPDPNATFECRLNGSAWAACSSPTTTFDAIAGDNLFEVRAKSAGGVVDPSPATRSWFVQDSGGGGIS